MLLAESKWAALPVRHLFAFANFEIEHFFSHLCEACLLCGHEDLTVISLCIDKIPHVLVKVHSRQMLSKHIHVAFE